MTPTIVSIQIGLTKTYHAPGANDGADKTYRTAIRKDPVLGPVYVRRLSIDGDGQTDLRVHGGPDRPVLAYAADHYPGWQSELGEPLFTYGAFGENLSIINLKEEDVCIGDVFESDEVRFEVSQPRQPCFKLARRWNRPELVARVHETGWGGWYMRVLKEGTLSAGESIRLVNRINPEWTIAKANLVMNHRRQDLEATEALAAVPKLCIDWVNDLTERAAKLRGRFYGAKN